MHMQRRLCSAGSFLIVALCSFYYIISYYDNLAYDSTNFKKHKNISDSRGFFHSLWYSNEIQSDKKLGIRDYKPLWKNYSIEDSMPFIEQKYTVIDTNSTFVQRFPQVLIIGAKKCGTRALLEFLKIHPAIRTPGPEIHFFDKYYYLGPEWYKKQFPSSLESQVTIEKTPAYFVNPAVPPRVKTLIPDVRLLLIVRNPVTRAISDYVQSVSNHKLKKDFVDLAFINASTGLVRTHWSPINGGLYANHLSQWLIHFPISRFYVVDGEMLIQDPAREIARVQDYLQIKQVISDRHFYFNTSKGFPCLIKREKSGKPYCLGPSKGRKHPDVGSDVIQILQDFFRPFNHKFFKMIGQTFDWSM